MSIQYTVPGFELDQGSRPISFQSSSSRIGYSSWVTAKPFVYCTCKCFILKLPHRLKPEEDAHAESTEMEEEAAASDELNAEKRNPYSFGLGKKRGGTIGNEYGFGLGKRNPYAFGLGKRVLPPMQLGKKDNDPIYAFGLGKRNPYAFGLGKRNPYAFGLGKRNPYAFGLGKKRDPYAFGLGKRDPYSFGLGK